MKKFLLGFALYVLPVALIIGLEWYLRVAVPSLENPLTRRVTYDQVEWYEVNRGYLQKYFPPNSPLVPEFKTALFKRRKDSSVFRIFCLGESTMFGTPYQMTCNIPGILRKQLRHLYPQQEFEVLNFGASAINSNVILDVSRTLIEYQPDLVLLYVGHNEFYGPDGVSASIIEKTLDVSIPLKYRLQDLRLMALLRNLLSRARMDTSTLRNPNLMKQVSQGSGIPLKSDAASRIFRLFESNLRGIIRTFKGKHIPVIVSDVASNLRFAPFVSDSSREGENGLREVDGMVRAGRNQEALDKLLQLAGVDSTNANLNYRLGMLSLALSNPEAARQYLSKARDNDLLKFRAPQRTNDIIRMVCSEEGVPCISNDSLFTQKTLAGIPADSLFWEHLHPTAYGYYLMANLFLRQILELGLVPQTSHTPLLKDTLTFNPDSLSICWLDRAYADLSIQRLTSNWPFNNYQKAPVVLDAADDALRRIAIDTFDRKLDWDDACYRIAMHFWRQGRTRDAVTTYEALLEEYAYNFYTHYLLGSLLNQTGNRERAIEHYLFSIRSNPRYPNSQLDLGLIEVNAGKFDEAKRRLEAAIELSTDQAMVEVRANAFYGLSAVYANTMEYEKALRYADQAIALVPGYRDALALRSTLLRRKDR